MIEIQLQTEYSTDYVPIFILLLSGRAANSFSSVATKEKSQL